MVGLGCGARSYTRSLHYSNDYAVNAKQIHSIIEHYVNSDAFAFDYVNYGFELNCEEQLRQQLPQTVDFDLKGVGGFAPSQGFHPCTPLKK
jgi:hypothetical protein